MKTFTAGAVRTARQEAIQQLWIRKGLLICGILSVLLYIPTTILGAAVWEGYSSSAQSVSELFAIGAPSQPVVVPLLIVYSVLVYAFGVGIWQSAGQKRALRVVAVLVIAKEVFGVLATVVFPVHVRGSEGTISDTMHIIFTGVGVLLCMFPAIIFGAASFGKKFRLFSIGTILIFLLGGTMAFMDAPRIAANLPTPLNGVWERMNIFGYLLWYSVLAVTLLRAQPDDSRAY